MGLSRVEPDLHWAVDSSGRGAPGGLGGQVAPRPGPGGLLKDAESCQILDWISNQRFPLADLCSPAVSLQKPGGAWGQFCRGAATGREGSWSRRLPLSLSASLPMALPQREA